MKNDQFIWTLQIFNTFLALNLLNFFTFFLNVFTIIQSFQKISKKSKNFEYNLIIELNAKISHFAFECIDI